MQYFKNTIIAITIFLSLISFSHSDTSWIKKKSDKVNGFCVQKGSESSFGYPVTVLKNSSLCEGKDIVVTRENNSELFRFLKVRNVNEREREITKQRKNKSLFVKEPSANPGNEDVAKQKI